MSYYRGSMSIRGRGASFRGNSYRGTSNYRGGNSYRGSNSYGDRGGYSSGSSRGGRYHSSNNSYSTGYQDSRSRYTNATEKYNSRGRDDGYRRSSYRGDEQYSGSRDHSRGSPDRKRMRTDQGSSSRRSNDGGYNPSGADSYNNQRYESSSYGVERRYSSERHVRSPKDFRSRNDGPAMYNKSSDSTSMPPPRSRGSFRGRMTSRGIRGRGSIRRIEPFTRKRISELYVKRRNVPRSMDYARRLKIQKMRSTVKKRDSASSNESEKEDWDAEMEELEKKKNTEDKESSPKKVSPKKEKPEKKTSGDEASDKEEDNTGSGDEAQLDEESEKEEGEEQEKSKEISRNRFNGRSSFIKLICCHCTVKCITFKEYILHLRSPRHTNSMRRLALKQKGQLARMRLFQRNAQRDIDEKNKDIPGLRTQFCPLCKLNYRQLKSKHQMSEAHRDMKKFLMPYCRICKITFKSPMLYEAHMCSLDHLKRKARVDYFKTSKMEIDEQVSGEEDECIKELDLDNFMTLDSVGDVDDVDDEEEDQENAEGDKKDSTENEKGKTPKTEINVGNEHVRKVELYYCDLCKIYLPRNEEPELSLKKHCRTRSHLKKYVRYRDDKALRREAERIHRKNQEAKEAKEKEAEKVDESNVVTPKKEKDSKDTAVLDDSATSGGHALENGSLDEEDAGDDKLWADVDKDLGELLREVEPNKSSDDEDDSRATSVRYDRFRYSDKKGGADEKGTTQSDDMKDNDQVVIAENSDDVKAEEK